MIRGRYQSLYPQDVVKYRKRQIEKEKERRPKYGLGVHVIE